MASVFGVFGPQDFVVLVVAIIGLIPVFVYYEKTPNLFVVPYACLFVAAVATNLEELFFPTLLNLVEHSVGNMGAGVTFAVAAYLYRERRIDTGPEEGLEADATEKGV